MYNFIALPSLGNDNFLLFYLYKYTVTQKGGTYVKDFHLCPRYTCRLIEGVKVGPSPYWLKKQLEASGQKSINNVVDIANYIMLKVGQPLHAFDYDLLEGTTIEAGPSKHAEKFLGLGLDVFQRDGRGRHRVHDWGVVQGERAWLDDGLRAPIFRPLATVISAIFPGHWTVARGPGSGGG